MQGWIGTTELKRKTYIDLETIPALFLLNCAINLAEYLRLWEAVGAIQMSVF